MTFETALAQSINIPAVKVLYLVGIRPAITFAKSFGLSSLGDPDQYGLTLVLGGGEVRLLDLTSAYSVFANEGVRNPPTGILEVTDSQGTVLEKYTPQPTQVIPPSLAHDMSAMLSDAPARVPEYALTSPLSFPNYEVAVKTGTTNDTRDAWTVGYTPSIAMGVWVGNNDNTPMAKTIAGFIAVPMWHEVMAYALEKYPKAYFGEASPISASLPPMLRGQWQMPDANGEVVPHDLLYWVDKDNPLIPATTQTNDPQFTRWEYGVAAWYATHPEYFTGGIMLPVPLSN
jgi:membrane peptidoglycan carboxypeptidase